MKDLTQEVKALAMKEGADLVGIASTENWEDEAGRRPGDFMLGTSRVIVLAVRILSPPAEKGSLRYYEYSAGMADDILNKVGYKIAKLLMDRGYKAYPMKDNFPLGSLDQAWRSSDWFKDFEKEEAYRNHLRGEISFKYAAKRAGLGVFGKSGLIVTPKYGPLIHLLPVLTDAPLRTDKPLDVDICKDCTLCIDLCPGKAISESGLNNVVCFETEISKGVGVPGVPYKVCPAYCIRMCPVGNPNSKKIKDERTSSIPVSMESGAKAEFDTCRITRTNR